MGQNDPSLCVIRKYQLGDQERLVKIITEATMSQVQNFFWTAIFSEAVPEIVIVLIALLFIGFSLPFKICLMCVPPAIALLYFIIWVGHYIKAVELHQDIQNISTVYMSDSSTCFFVAELYGNFWETEFSKLTNKVKKVEYDFLTEKELEVRGLNISGMKKCVVGCVAITKSMKSHNTAWLRRMAVKAEFRRCGIASHLLERALDFCRQAGYEGVELVTTECHTEAAALYMREGFNCVKSMNKNYLFVGPSQLVQRMILNLKKKSNDSTQRNKELDELEGQIFEEI